MTQEDTELTEDAICPYCGHKQRDSWECEENGSYFCGNCDEKFFLTIHCSIRYSTDKMKEEINGGL